MKLLKLFFLFAMFISNAIPLISQKENFNWCFHNNNGITFNTQDTIPEYFDGVNFCNHHGWHATINYFNSISDSGGNLLFYTGDSRYDIGGNYYINPIMNKHHKMVENSAEKNSENPYYTQLLLPYPGKRNLIINLKSSMTQNHIAYDVIDINEKNGNGKVINKNNIIKRGKDCVPSTIVIRHSNRLYYWLITYDGMHGLFRNYLFTGTKLIDSTKYICNDEVMARHWSFSKNGKYTASFFATEVYHEKNNYRDYDNSNCFLRLISFNSTTGKMSSRSIKLCDTCGIEGWQFSSDGGKFYYVEMKRERPNEFWHFTHSIYQLTISNNIQQIEKSKTIVAPPISDYVLGDYIVPKPPDPDGEKGLYSGLRIGPNNKIYIIRRNFKYLSSLSNIDGPAEDVVFTDSAVALKHIAYDFPYILNDYYNVYLDLDVNTPVCLGEVIALKSSLSDTLYPRSYKWTGPAGFVSQEQNPYIANAQKKNIGWYVMEATVNGAKLYDSIYVDVTEAEPPAIAGDKKSYIQQTKLYRTDNGKNKINIWSVEGGEIVGISYFDSVMVRWTKPGRGKVTLEQRVYEVSCPGYNEFEVEVKDWDKPQIQGDNDVCLNDTIDYEVYYAPELKYNWTVTKCNIIKQNKNKIRVNWNTIGNGTLTVITENALSHKKDTTTQSVLVNPNPPKQQIEYKGAYLVTKEYDSHQWYLNGKKIIGATRHFYKPTKDGAYQVIVIDKNGCKSLLSEPYNFVSDVAEIRRNSNDVITPNPAGDYIDIAVAGNRILKDAVKVYDVLGNVVLSSPACSAGTPSEGGHIRVDVSGLAAGVYFIRVGGKMYKFVKM